MAVPTTSTHLQNTVVTRRRYCPPNRMFVSLLNVLMNNLVYAQPPSKNSSCTTYVLYTCGWYTGKHSLARSASGRCTLHSLRRKLRQLFVRALCGWAVCIKKTYCTHYRLRLYVVTFVFLILFILTTATHARTHRMRATDCAARSHGLRPPAALQ